MNNPAVTSREAEIHLTPRDWSWLLNLIENPPKPNATLMAAMKRYEKAKQDDFGRSFNWVP